MIDGLRWKFIAITAILAMVVSLLAGGIGGIRLGTMVFRALIAGVAFAGIAAGANLLIARLFPEILGKAETDSGETPPPGNWVDLVVGGEDDDGSEISAEAGTAESADDISDTGGDVSGGEASGEFSRLSEDVGDAESKGSGDSRSWETLGGEHDPGEIAQVIQTVLKRDEKG